jgi:hypothetical protein
MAKDKTKPQTEKAAATAKSPAATAKAKRPVATKWTTGKVAGKQAVSAEQGELR